MSQFGVEITNQHFKLSSIIENYEEYQEAFITFGDPDLFSDSQLEQNVFNTIQSFFCEVKKVVGVIDIDALRLQLFINTWFPTSVKNSIEKM